MRKNFMMANNIFFPGRSKSWIKTWLIPIALAIQTIALAQGVSTQIKLNQIGFLVHSPKIAIVTAHVSSDIFYIITTNLRDTLFSGKLGAERKSAYSSTITRVADFSGVEVKGTYVVDIPGMGQSYAFQIDDEVYRDIGISVLKGYYYQRASMELVQKFAGRWQRSSGHPDNIVYVHASAADSKRPEGTVIAAPGGWYDAGDYNKYIVNSGITMGTLLSAYEEFPGYFDGLKTNIPESGDAVPDILNEIIYNLRWMLTMQDPSDGGVYHKCTNASFDGMVMPGVTQAPRYVVQKGTAATLDLAAVTAQAARVFRKFKRQLPGLADSCLKAALKAWDWSLSNPTRVYDQNAINQRFKPAIVTGAYGDNSFDDEKFWAAAELLVTTGDRRFGESISIHVKDEMRLPSWANVSMLGYYTCLRFPGESKLGAADLTVLRQKIIDMANGYLEKQQANAFLTVMGQSSRDYNWGGNSNAANQGILLVKAFQLTGDRKYIAGALSNLDYILGRNATGYCFVTGAGSKSPVFPHHRQSTADGIAEPVPGLLVGGPNAGMQDKCTYEFTETETAYVDSVCSYASNEIAINWNAPLVYLANALEALNRVLSKN